MNAQQIELLRIEAKFLGAAASKLMFAAEYKKEQADQEANPPAEKDKCFINDPEISAGCSEDAESDAECYWNAARKARELNILAADPFDKLSDKSAEPCRGRKRRGR